MKIINIQKVKKEKAFKPLFTGEVTMQNVISEKDGADNNLSYVNFPKSVHNKFHKHSHDQILVVTKGKGFIETKKEKKTLSSGDIVWAPKGEEHRHGALKSTNFSHITITKKGTKLTQTEA